MRRAGTPARRPDLSVASAEGESHEPGRSSTANATRSSPPHDRVRRPRYQQRPARPNRAVHQEERAHAATTAVGRASRPREVWSGLGDGRGLRPVEGTHYIRIGTCRVG